MAKSTSKRTDVSKGAFAAEATVSDRIAATLATLTPAHQRMAEYVLANPFRAATMRIDEFAAAVEMSIATANRFALALGFDGYPQFRAGLLRGFEATLAPVEKLRHELARPATSAEIFAASLNEDIANLDATRRMLDPAACERAVDAILGAQRIYVMGFGASGYLAGLLRHGLDLYCDTVISVSQPGGASDAARQLRKIGQKDLLIAIAFPRYAADTITLAKQAGDQGCQVLALTDGPTSPLAPLADIALYARPERQFSATSDTAAVALFEALCGAVAHRSAHSLESAERLTEFVLPWLHTGQAPRANAAQGNDAANAPTTRRGRKRAAEN
ncbi:MULTISPECIES: MurR/RpiR family transcriptional regulator [Ralstonia]|jgi:DNA-binding MurR/RpiR family transcriptional regulator|uniref:HTH-type transcriptional regulator MurR n=1 Tax=Ralstonia flaminis TaxID=3058597 RepID=A0ABN9JHV6_9RALS|nr:MULTISPECIES: MurR/RpiR family transcriptional regulator [unclassified Ralstonia]CAJ0812292.1 HTH-type transcriptional regulator MurR [Ralstonia sp. LMG 18101]